MRPRRSTPFRLAAVLTLTCLSASCVSTQLAPISSSGGGFRPLADEQELWESARAEEEQLLAKVTLYPDPLLESYLEGVVGRLTPPGMAANPAVHYRVRVIEDPTLNAFAYPHGSLYVHTGLLARMEDEDELATVLGHEMTHVENRHMLRYQRSAHNRQVGLLVAAVAVEVAAAVAEENAYRKGDWGKGETIDLVSDLLVGLGLPLAILASINGYGRALELEADQGGFAKVTAAGYDLAQSPKLYEALLDDHGDSGKTEAFFFGSHPRLAERIESSKRYVAAHPQAGGRPAAADPAEFARRIRPVVRDDARLNIDIGRLKLAESELDRVRGEMPDDPETWHQTGRLRLAQAGATAAGSAERSRLGGEAATAFRRAIELDDSRAAPHRELGLLLYERQEWQGACTELRRYVERVRGEERDAKAVGTARDHLHEMQRDGHCK